MAKLSHSNVVKVYGMCPAEADLPTMLVMELVQNGSLRDYLINNKGSVVLNQKVSILKVIRQKI